MNVPPKSVDNDRAERELICEDPNTGSIVVKKAFQETHNVINAYLVALGQLAADEVTNFISRSKGRWFGDSEIGRCGRR